MKVWQAFGSGHSADLTVVGRFKTTEDAKLIYEIVEDYVNAACEERYANMQEFREAWKDRLRGLEMLGPNDYEFDLGIEGSSVVERQDRLVKVTEFRTANVGGIIKIMLMKFPEKVEVSGRTGP